MFSVMDQIREFRAYHKEPIQCSSIILFIDLQCVGIMLPSVPKILHPANCAVDLLIRYANSTQPQKHLSLHLPIEHDTPSLRDSTATTLRSRIQRTHTIPSSGTFPPIPTTIKVLTKPSVESQSKCKAYSCLIRLIGL